VRGHHAQHREQRVYGVPEVEPSVHEENATFGGMRIESDSDGALSSYVVFQKQQKPEVSKNRFHP
jgi:hypothetical protein